MTTNENIEQKAKEFIEVGNKIYGESMGMMTLEECSSNMKGLLLGIARHVLAAEIEARIEILKNFTAEEPYPVFLKSKMFIESLEIQLAEIKK